MADEIPKLDEVEQALADELLLIHEESYGRGAKRARAHILDDQVIVTLDDIEFLPNEQFMIDHGEEEAVLQTRTRYQQAVGESFIAAVERATGRRVISFASLTKLDPDYVVEFFRLAPASDAGLEEPEDG